VPRESGTEFIAECLWPGVRESDLGALDDRAAATAARLSSEGEPVGYLGSLLMREDEVVFCLFRGRRTAVQAAASEADIPFERILAATRSPWALSTRP
jgi:hypothetical protein